LDFNGENLPDLKSTIQKKYPDVKVSFERISGREDPSILPGASQYGKVVEEVTPMSYDLFLEALHETWKL